MRLQYYIFLVNIYINRMQSTQAKKRPSRRQAQASAPAVGPLINSFAQISLASQKSNDAASVASTSSDAKKQPVAELPSVTQPSTTKKGSRHGKKQKLKRHIPAGLKTVELYLKLMHNVPQFVPRVPNDAHELLLTHLNSIMEDCTVGFATINATKKTRNYDQYIQFMDTIIDIDGTTVYVIDLGKLLDNAFHILLPYTIELTNGMSIKQFYKKRNPLLSDEMKNIDLDIMNALMQLIDWFAEILHTTLAGQFKFISFKLPPEVVNEKFIHPTSFNPYDATKMYMCSVINCDFVTRDGVKYDSTSGTFKDKILVPRKEMLGTDYGKIMTSPFCSQLTGYIARKLEYHCMLLPGNADRLSTRLFKQFVFTDPIQVMGVHLTAMFRKNRIYQTVAKDSDSSFRLIHQAFDGNE